MLSLSLSLPRLSRGAAAVEAALVSLPLVTMAIAAADFARAMFVYDELVKSVREGARYLSFFDPTDAATYPGAIAAAKSRMIYGKANPASGDPTTVPGLADPMISICDAGQSQTDCYWLKQNPPVLFKDTENTPSGTINVVEVMITGYVFTPMFPGASKLATITFEPISVTMRQLY